MLAWLRSRPGATFLVALAASLWGLDAWIRAPLAQSTAVATIVFGEHVLLVLLTLPFLFGQPDCFLLLPASSVCGYTTSNGNSNCSNSQRVQPEGIEPP